MLSAAASASLHDITCPSRAHIVTVACLQACRSEGIAKRPPTVRSPVPAVANTRPCRATRHAAWGQEPLAAEASTVAVPTFTVSARCVHRVPQGSYRQ